MKAGLSKLLQSLTLAEQAEVETFAAFLLARRKLKKVQVSTDDMSTEELLQLVTDAGGFEWLDAPEEDVYSAGEPSYCVLELKGLGKEIWQGIDAQEYVDQERSLWGG